MIFKCFDRLSFKDNPFRCSYVLPDGITCKKGFVKDIDEAHKYCSLPADGESEREDLDVDTNKTENRKKPELSQNVTSWILFMCHVFFWDHLMKFYSAGICLDQ
jgi:hypothetical protein